MPPKMFCIVLTPSLQNLKDLDDLAIPSAEIVVQLS